MSDGPQLTEAERRLRKLTFRAWHRGTKEVDFILGRFADGHLAGLAPADLDAFERLLDAPDQDIFDWVTGRRPVPAEFDTALFARVRAAAFAALQP